MASKAGTVQRQLFKVVPVPTLVTAGCSCAMPSALLSGWRTWRMLSPRALDWALQAWALQVAAASPPALMAACQVTWMSLLRQGVHWSVH